MNKVRQLMPQKDLLYFADEGHLPYGEKSKEEILSYSIEAVSILNRFECDAVIIACNTATSAAIKTLRKRFSIPIIGIEPAVKPALKGEGKVLVMATPVTLKEEKLHNLISDLSAQEKVDLLAMPELVRFCECEEFDSVDVKRYIEERLEGIDRTAYSALVLGCTHFNHFRFALSGAFDDRIHILDGSMGTARRLREVLREQGMTENGEGRTEYLLTGGVLADEEFILKAERMLKHLQLTEG